MNMHTLLIPIPMEDMAHIEALAESGGIRCSCCGSSSWDPPEPRLAIVNEVPLGTESLEKKPPTVILSISCSKCGKRESFDYDQFAAYSKDRRANLGQRLRHGIQRVRSMIAESPFNPALLRLQHAADSSSRVEATSGR